MKKWRPPKYTKKTFFEKVDEYIKMRMEWNGKGLGKWPITILDFCIFAGVCKDYISEHDGHRNRNLDFSDAIKRLRTYAEYSLEYYAILGKIPPAVAIFSLKNNYGWKDKQEVGFTDKDGNDRKIERVEIEIVAPNTPNNEN